MKLAALGLFVSSLWAGQSLTTTTNSVSSSTVPNRGNFPSRLECYVHDFPVSPGDRLVNALYLGMDVQFSSGAAIRLNPNMLSGGSLAVIDIGLSALPGQQIYFRAQYDGVLTASFEASLKFLRGEDTC